jgi:Mg-chelatase subunit ChlD
MMSAFALALVCAPSVATPQDASPQAPKTTFRSTVDVVSVAAIVRDKRGRFASGLKKEDFLVEEGGSRRDILQFHADSDAPVRVALLFDVSGSMRLGDRVEEARQAARHVLGALRMGARGGAFGAPAEPNAGGIRQLINDEAAVYSFDMNLQSLQPFTVDAGAIESALARVTPYGQTSLYDAIAQTARRVADTSPGDPRRRAVVVFTDGIDTSSQLTAVQVSSIASEIDVPVYVMTVVSNAPAHKSVAARQIVDELRHQYVLAFTASTAAGWRPLTVKTRDRDLTVRARRGYAAGIRAGS